MPLVRPSGVASTRPAVSSGRVASKVTTTQFWSPWDRENPIGPPPTPVDTTLVAAVRLGMSIEWEKSRVSWPLRSTSVDPSPGVDVSS